MFRYKNSIRLTALDHQLYDCVVGSQSAAPTTVGDYNQRLERAVKVWSGGQSMGELRLAQMARALMLDPLDPSDVLCERQLKKRTFS